MDLASLAVKISRSDSLGILSPVVSKITRLASDPKVPVSTLEAVLNSDPALTAKVLKAANSALYSLRTPANSVGAAVMVLGMRTVQSIVLNAAYQQVLKGSGTVPYFDKEAFWSHCLATAISAKRLAGAKGLSDVESYYSIGMLHEVGMLAMAAHLPTEWSRALQGARRTKLSLHRVEERLIGFSSQSASLVILEKWGVGEVAVNCVRHMLELPVDHDHLDGIAVLSVADSMAHQAGFENQSVGAEVGFDPLALDVLGLKDEFIEQALANLPEQVKKLQDAFRIA